MSECKHPIIWATDDDGDDFCLADIDRCAICQEPMTVTTRAEHDRLQAEHGKVGEAIHPFEQVLALAAQAARTPVDRAIVNRGYRAITAVKEASRG